MTETPLIHASWRERRCEVCDCVSLVPLGRRRLEAPARGALYEFLLDDVACESCGFVFACRVPDEAFLQAYYEHAFTLESAYERIEPDYDEGARLAAIRRFVPHGSRVLEVGAGVGTFCQSLRAAGFAATGVDPLVHDASIPDVVGNDVADSRLAVGYDAVLSYYVGEHVLDIRTWIAALVERTVAGGTLILEVPDFERFPQESLYWEHLRHFTPYHLCRLLAGAGLEVIEIDLDHPSRYFGLVVVARRSNGAAAPPGRPWPGVAYSRTLYAAGIRAEEAEVERATIAARQIVMLARGRARPCVIFWAANPLATRIVRALPAADMPEVMLVDNASQKIGAPHPGFTSRISRPEFANLTDCDKIFVLCSPAWNDQIAEQIRAMGLSRCQLIDAAALLRPSTPRSSVIG